uniref:Uncharacterized protein n=1 Tax=Panagrolaimus sp. PS1159 TaxID=55785 RepID=A0AC35F4S5_9BILA
MKLTESGEVKELDIIDTKIVDSGNSIVPIDKIFKCVLNANCITYLSLYEINEVLDVDSFAQFIKNNFDVDRLIYGLSISFNNVEDTTLFKSRLRQILKF